MNSVRSSITVCLAACLVIAVAGCRRSSRDVDRVEECETFCMECNGPSADCTTPCENAEADYEALRREAEDLGCRPELDAYWDCANELFHCNAEGPCGAEVEAYLVCASGP